MFINFKFKCLLYGRNIGKFVFFCLENKFVNVLFMCSYWMYNKIFGNCGRSICCVK